MENNKPGTPHSQPTDTQETPANSNGKDAALAQLLDMGYDVEMVSVIIASLPDVPEDAADSLVQRVVEIVSDQSSGLAKLQQNSSVAQTSPVAITIPAKSILKSNTSAPESGFFAQARTWFTKQLPTSVSTLGNTIVNKIAPVPDTAHRIHYRSTLDRRPRLAKPVDTSWEETASTLERSRKVRFSSENINIEPEAPDSDDSDAEKPSQPTKPEPASSSSVSSGHVEMQLGNLGPDAETVHQLELDQVLKHYLTECERRREQPVVKLMDQLKADELEQSHRIDLTGETLDKKNVLPLSDVLACRFGLQHLVLENCHIDDDAVLNSVLAVDTVTSLNVANNRKLSNIGIKYICIFIKRSAELKTLDMSKLLIDKTACAYLSHALMMGRVTVNTKPSESLGASLEMLKLDDCKIKSPALLQALLPGVVMSNLTVLSLKRNGIDAAGGPWIAEMMKPDDELRQFKAQRVQAHGDAVPRRRHGLRHLDVSENPIGGGMSAIAASLCLNSTVRHLDARHVNMDHACFTIVAEMLSINKGLRTLDLADNAIGANSQGFEVLKDALSINKTLKSLNLSNTGLTTETAILLAEALPLSSLESLNLAGNPIELAGVMALAAAIKSNETFTQLVLEPFSNTKGNTVTIADVDHLLQDIAAVVQRNQALAKQRLELQTNGLSPEEAEMLREEKEDQEMEKEAQLEEERKRLRAQEQLRIQQEALLASAQAGVPRMPDRAYDDETIQKELDSLKESFVVLTEMMHASKTEKSTTDELLDSLYLQCSELRSRLLGALNDNLISGELRRKVTETNDLVGPMLDAIADANSNKPKKYQPRPNSTPLKSALKKHSPQKLLPETDMASADEAKEEALVKKKPAASRSDTLDNLLKEVGADPAETAEGLDKLQDQIDAMLAIDDKVDKAPPKKQKKGKQ